MDAKTNARLEKKLGNLIGYLRQIHDKRLRQSDDNLKARLRSFAVTLISPASESMIYEIAKKNKKAFGDVDFRSKEGKQRVINTVIEYWAHTYLPHIFQLAKEYVSGKRPAAFLEILKQYDRFSIVNLANEYIAADAKTALGPEEPDEAPPEETNEGETPLTEESAGKVAIKKIARNVMGTMGAAALGAVYSKGGALTKTLVTMGAGAVNAARPAGEWLKSKFSAQGGGDSKSFIGSHSNKSRDFTPKEEKIEGERERGKIVSLLENIEENTRDGAKGTNESKSSFAGMGAMLGGFLSRVGPLLLKLAPVLGAIAALLGATAGIPKGLGGIPPVPKLPSGPGASTIATNPARAGGPTSIMPNPSRGGTAAAPSTTSAGGTSGPLGNLLSKAKSVGGGVLDKAKSAGQAGINTTGAVLNKAGRALGFVAMGRDVFDVSRAVVGGDTQDISETVGKVGGGWAAVGAASPFIAKASLAAAAVSGPAAPIVAPVVAMGLSAAAYWGGSGAGKTVGEGVGMFLNAKDLDSKKKEFTKTEGGSTAGSGTGTLTRSVETGSAAGNYGKVNPSDRGEASYGAYQFRDGNGGLSKFMYKVKSNPEFDSIAKKFKGLKPATKEFNDVWKSLGDDKLFQKAQDDTWNEFYRIPALRYAKEKGVKTNSILDEIIASSWTAGPELTKKAIDKAANTKGFEKLEAKEQGKLIIEELDKFNGKNQFTSDRLEKQKNYFNQNIDTVSSNISTERSSVSGTLSGPGGAEMARQMNEGVSSDSVGPLRQESWGASMVRGISGSKKPVDVTPYSKSATTATNMVPAKSQAAAPTIVAPKISTSNNYNQTNNKQPPPSPWDSNPNVRRLQDGITK